MSETRPYQNRPEWALTLHAWDFAEVGRAGEARKLLARAMSDISEHGSCAVWEWGVEHALWGMACELRPADGKPFEVLTGPLPAADVVVLRVLASLAGGWVEWGEVSEAAPCLLDGDTDGRGCVFVAWVSE